MIVDTLKVYVTVVEQCNFSRAAKLLNLSQPGVSMHIRNLENEFGIKLIHRSPRHVKTTDAGHILYQRAKQMLALYDNAKEEIHLLRDEVTGSLKVGASFTIGEYILPRLIADFARQYPQVDIQVMIANTEEIAQAVRANELDIGLVEGKVDYADILVDHPFMEDEMILVAPGSRADGAAEAGGVHASGSNLILRESGSGTRSYSEQFIRDLGVEPKRTYVFNSSQGVKEAVLAGLGIALLSRWVIHKELEAGELRRIHVKGGRVIRPFFILQDTKAASTMAMKMLIQQVRQLS